MAFSISRHFLRCTKTITNHLKNPVKNSCLTPYTTLTALNLQKEEIDVTFVRANGEKIKVKGKVGDNLLDVVINNNVDIDGFGACEGTLTCSTCHLILKPEDYKKLPETPSEEEDDMLDLAFEVTETSRLGCQVTLTKDLDGIELKIPATINDLRNNDS